MFKFRRNPAAVRVHRAPAPLSANIVWALTLIVLVPYGVAILFGATAGIVHGSLIIDTHFSSSIIDSQGVAVATGPITCGIDALGPWCEVAHS